MFIVSYREKEQRRNDASQEFYAWRHLHKLPKIVMEVSTIKMLLLSSPKVD